MIGELLDKRYKVLQKLGEGGMGEVYLVEHVNLKRREALKILLKPLAEDPQYVSRFRREARATNRLQHPNVVGVHDFGQLPDGRFYLSMEFAEGVSLYSILKSGPMTVPRTLHVLGQLADAIDHAHAHGVVHRDLKPENLLLVEHRGRTDVLKVLDFGIAKIVSPDYQESIALTKKDEVFGTPEYMAPERFSGAPSEPAADLYSVGCIAYELVVGKPPFTGRAMQVLHAQMTEPPVPPSRKNPAAKIPPELDEIILGLLAKKPEDRIPSGKILHARLRQVDGYGVHAAGEYSLIRTSGFANDEDTAKRAVGEPHTSHAHRDSSQFSKKARAAAEKIVDEGAHDAKLLLAISQLKQVESELQRVMADQAALEHKGEEMEEQARRRASTLRFALGELTFERSQMMTRGEKPPAELDAEIKSLEGRIREIEREAENDLQALEERALELALARSDLEEQQGNLAEALMNGVKARK